jgi:hypothetical protein
MKVGAGGKIMNESINPKSLVACMFADPKKSALVKVRCALLLAVLVIADFTAMAPAQSSACNTEFMLWRSILSLADC